MTSGNRADRIEHDGPRLLWQQVADDITADMDAGVLKSGWRLPSEAELVEVYGVARVTVRRAIAELVKDGKLTVVRGRGTFVV